MCNLSEGVWEKGFAVGFAKGFSKGFSDGFAEGEFIQLVYGFEMLMSSGMCFDEIADLLDITPDTVAQIRERLYNQKA
ncbi:MAG: hypothetical protein NC253_01705 [Ruminococcus sp.]|nr:hypothetical protein [Ruminococcus sp.]MCM1380750.1 hypothetical protein [Muribaculaceae bacterium]MCM1478710.1 hypothetical protein [Muribaculaceae bacterium]